MTPKEKAKEMYIKFDFVYVQNYTSKFEVKRCALIAVDEILQILVQDFEKGQHRANDFLDCWQEVKQEIELL
jgi:ribosome recycling factor